MNKWDRRFMDLALQVKGWSKDPENQVGAVLVSPDRRQFATGYNGFPAGFQDETGLLIMSAALDANLKFLKSGLAVHAEVNAVLNCHVRPNGWTMYSTRCPCLPCASTLVQAGVNTLYCPGPEPKSSWYNSHKAAMQLLNFGVTPPIRVYIVEEEA